MISISLVLIWPEGLVHDRLYYDRPRDALGDSLERWHPKTLLFHLLHGEMFITLDDVSHLLHLPIRGRFLDQGG